MNINELEKLAREAQDPDFPWIDRDAMIGGLFAKGEIDYIAAAKPAAILELIERLKAAEYHLGNILSDPFAEDCQECAIGTATSWANAKAALARANGESNE